MQRFLKDSYAFQTYKHVILNVIFTFSGLQLINPQLFFIIEILGLSSHENRDKMTNRKNMTICFLA